MNKSIKVVSPDAPAAWGLFFFAVREKELILATPVFFSAGDNTTCFGDDVPEKVWIQSINN